MIGPPRGKNIIVQHQPPRVPHTEMRVQREESEREFLVTAPSRREVTDATAQTPNENGN